MSQGDKSRAKRPAAKKAAAPARAAAPAKAAVPAKAAARTPAAAAADSLEARVRSLESERDRLTAELAEAHARIAKLEAARTQVVNRIDWVIDSLQNLIEGEG